MVKVWQPLIHRLLDTKVKTKKSTLKMMGVECGDIFVFGARGFCFYADTWHCTLSTATFRPGSPWMVTSWLWPQPVMDGHIPLCLEPWVNLKWTDLSETHVDSCGYKAPGNVRSRGLISREVYLPVFLPGGLLSKQRTRPLAEAERACPSEGDSKGEMHKWREEIGAERWDRTNTQAKGERAIKKRTAKRK